MKPIHKFIIAGMARLSFPIASAIAALLAVALPLRSQAAPVTWGTATPIAAATDIQSAGVTNLEGADFGLTNGTTTTVNNGSVNVNFQSLLYTQTVTLTNGVGVALSSFNFNAAAGNGTISGDYGAILSRHIGSFGGTPTITLSGLTAGTEYQIQVFAMGGIPTRLPFREAPVCLSEEGILPATAMESEHTSWEPSLLT